MKFTPRSEGGRKGMKQIPRTTEMHEAILYACYLAHIEVGICESIIDYYGSGSIFGSRKIPYVSIS